MKINKVYFLTAEVRLEVQKGAVGATVINSAALTASKGLGGMKFLDYFRQAGFAMLSHKMRSALSILGILIGVAAVIAMLALGEGAKASIEKRLASLGANLLVVRPGSARVGGIALEAGLVTRFTPQDLSAVVGFRQGTTRFCR